MTDLPKKPWKLCVCVSSIWMAFIGFYPWGIDGKFLAASWDVRTQLVQGLYGCSPASTKKVRRWIKSSPDRWSFGFWKWERPIWMAIKQTPKVMRKHSMVPPPIFGSVNSFATNWMIQVGKDRWFFPQISWVETMALTYLELAQF